ncbi:MAG TPA: AAA family ATPase [Trueperaceae bacterium]|nr:AAA family ATPase [Trueperaceae bacterium]
MDTSHEDALFGHWLRRRRKSLDLTQKELARRVGCSPATIRKLEADERRPSKHVAAAIAGILGVPDSERDAFVRFARTGWAAAPPEHPTPDLERPWLGGRHDGRAGAAPAPATAADVPGATAGPDAARAGAKAQAVAEQAGGGNRTTGAGAGAVPLTPPAPDVPPVPRATTTRFLAREAELARLGAALEAATSGRGGVILLAGEAGQGKTSLMTAFAARALAAHPHLLAVSGTCNAYTGRGDAFAPFREVLRELTGEAPPSTDAPEYDAALRTRLTGFAPRVVAALLERGPNLLDTFVPASLLREPAGAGAGPAPSTTAAPPVLDLGAAASGNAALRAEAVAVLARVTAEAPLLLLLDDLQWADPSSLELLLQLARLAPRLRLLVVGAFRPEGAQPEDAAGVNRLAPTVRELERLFGDPVVDLGRADARAFLEAWIDAEPNDLGPAFRDALWRQTGGQPLFTVELLRSMQARGDLVRDGQGRWVESPELRWDTVPGRVAGALGERVARLDATAARVLRVAAIDGEVFTAELVARVLDLAPMDVARMLDEELDRTHRLVATLDVRRTADGQRVSRHRFRHNLIQRYVLEQVGPSERSYLHEAVAEASVALLGNEADPLAVAYHFAEAQAPAAAAPYQRTAGDRARRAGAVTEAIAAYREAADHWPAGDDAGRAAVLRDLGQCYGVRGDRDEAVKVLEEAQAAFERLGDAAGAAAAHSQIVDVEFFQRPEHGPAVAAYEKTLTVLQSAPETAESAEVARVLAMLAPHYVNRDDKRALALARRSLDLAERLGAEEERVSALVRLGDIIADTIPERREEGRAMMEEGLELARRLNFLEAGSYAAACLGNLYVGLGRLDEAASTLRQLISLAEAHGLEAVRHFRSLHLWALEWRRGHWQEAVDRMGAIREEGKKHPIFAVRLAEAALDLGRAAEAGALMAPWEDEVPAELVLHNRAIVERVRLRCAAAQGDAERADLAAFEFLRAAGARRTYPHQVVATALDVVRWLAARPGDAASRGVAHAHEILEATARHWATPETDAALGSARGILTWHDDVASAAEPLVDAAEAWADTGYPLDEARAHSAAAGALREAGRKARAAEALERASALLDGLAAQLPDGSALATSFATERERLLAEPLNFP